MRVIRNHVFETNSSSMHAITMTKDFSIPKVIEKVKFGIPEDDMEFGRGTGAVYKNANDKARYLWTLVILLTYPNKPDLIGYDEKEASWVTSYFPFSYNEVVKLVKYYLDDNCFIPDTSEFYDSDMSRLKDQIEINHQSFNENGWLLQVLSSKENFLNYLFGVDSKLYIKSDCAWEYGYEYSIASKDDFWPEGNLMDTDYVNGKYYSDYELQEKDLYDYLKNISKNLREILKNI